MVDGVALTVTAAKGLMQTSVKSDVSHQCHSVATVSIINITRTAYTAAVAMFVRLQFACVPLVTAAAVAIGAATPAVTARSSQRNVAQ